MLRRSQGGDRQREKGVSKGKLKDDDYPELKTGVIDK